MKKLLTLSMSLLTALSLTAVARADVIAGPAVTIYHATWLLPWFPVGAIVVITAFLLRKFWKKKK